MVRDATRLGAVFVLLRRVVAARAVRRLLILGGLVIACWVLGGAAQAAHADEISAGPLQIATRAPVLGDAVKTVHQPQPVRRVVQVVAEKEPREKEAPPDVPPLPAAPQAREAHHTGASAEATRTPGTHRRPQERERVPAASTVDTPAPTPGVSQPVAQHDPDPSQTPERSDGHSTAGASAVPVMTAALPNAVAWAPAPPRASGADLFGAVAPAVRTGADEPSFAPD